MRVIRALIVLVSLFSVVFAADSIENLELTSTPPIPIVGESLTSFSLQFKLSSSNGLSKDRLALLINDQTITDNLNIDFTNQDDNGGTTDVEISSSSIVFNQEENILTVRYLVGAGLGNLVQATSSIEITAQETTDDDESSNGETINNSSFNISLKDSLETNVVSDSPRAILMTVRHNKSILAPITNGSDLGQIINNLRIKRIDGAKPIGIKNEFDFELEKASEEIGNNFVETVFRANHPGIKEKQKLKFTTKITDFFDDFDESNGNTLSLKDSATIKFDALRTSINGISLDSAINFNVEKKKARLLTLTSDPVNITVIMDTNGGINVSSVDEVKYFTRNEKKKKTKAKIKTASKSINVKLNSHTSPVSSSNGSLIVIPTQFKFKTKSKKLDKNGFLNPSINKSVIIPLKIFAKDSNGLDLILEGRKEIDTQINFSGIEASTKEK